MSYDYGNARLRAMKSRLLTERDLEAMAGSENLERLIGALSQTNYREAVKSALVRSSGMACISNAIRINLVETMGKARKFYSDRAGNLVNLLFRYYDLHNIKAILRGISRHVPAEEISESLLPIGEISDSELSRLAQAGDVRVGIDMLASMRLPMARPLMKLRTEHPGAGTPEMELTLEKWYFEDIFEQVEEIRRGTDTFRQSLEVDADLFNLNCLVRFVEAPEERRMLHKWIGTENVCLLMVGPGKLSYDTLQLLSNRRTLREAIDALAGTAYEEALLAGFEAYQETGQLSEIERHLNRFRFQWRTGLATKDPLGIGVVIGYMALKTNEVSNIRRIAHGIRLAMSPSAIRNSLEVAM